jgi:predicted nucleic acid-binding Zn ribbon protein
LGDKRAVRIGEVLGRYLKRSGHAERVAQASVIADWAALVGPTVAAVTVPEAVARDGTLFVRVKTAPWMQELQFMTPEILQRLGPESRITRIIWRAD